LVQQKHTQCWANAAKKNEMSSIAEHEMPENPAMKIQFLHRQELSAPLSLKHAALTADT